MFIYKVVSIAPNSNADSVEKVLNEMGALEWEMCGTQTNNYGATIALIFMKKQ